MPPTLLCVIISIVVGVYTPLAYALGNHLVPGWRKIDGSLRSVLRYLVMCIALFIACFVVPLLISTSLVRGIGMLPSPDPLAEHALLRVFCAFGWLFAAIIFVACYSAISVHRQERSLLAHPVVAASMSPQRERLVAFIFLLITLPVVGICTAIGMSIVPYLEGGWDLVRSKWTAVGKPVELPSAVLGLLGIIGGFPLGYVICRKMALLTGLMTPEQVRELDAALGKPLRRKHF